MLFQTYALGKYLLSGGCKLKIRLHVRVRAQPSTGVTQESMNNVSCRRDMTEILLKAAYNTLQSINQTARPVLTTIPAFEEPLSRVLIDCVGPLPKSKSSIEYLLTIMCT